MIIEPARSTDAGAIPEGITMTADSKTSAILPPGPSTPPLIQSLSWTFGDPLQHLEKLGSRFGDAFTLKLYGPDTDLPNASWSLRRHRAIVLSHPEHVHAVFADQGDAFGVGEAYAFLEPVFGAKSLFIVEGREHLLHRRIMQRIMNDVRSPAGQALMCRAARQELASWREGVTFRAFDAFQLITFRLIYEFLFPDDYALGDFRKHLLTVSRTLSSPMIMFPFLRRDLGTFSPGRRIEAARNCLRQLIDRHVQVGRKGAPEEEVTWLHDLIEAVDGDGEHLTDEEVRDEVLTLLATGFESTGISLSFALYYLLQNPRLYTEMRAQLSCINLPDDTAELLDLEPLDYFIKEVLRLHPVVPIVIRQAICPIDVGAYRFEKGDYVLPCIYLTHRRPDIYENPSEFRPERFAGAPFSAHEYMPFGGGIRHCIGKPFAVQAMKIILCLVLQGIGLEPVSRRPIRTRRHHITIVPYGGIPIQVKKPPLSEANQLQQTHNPGLNRTDTALSRGTAG